MVFTKYTHAHFIFTQTLELHDWWKGHLRVNERCGTMRFQNVLIIHSLYFGQNLYQVHVFDFLITHEQ